MSRFFFFLFSCFLFFFFYYFLKGRKYFTQMERGAKKISVSIARTCCKDTVNNNNNNDMYVSCVCVDGWTNRQFNFFCTGVENKLFSFSIVFLFVVVALVSCKDFFFFFFNFPSSQFFFYFCWDFPWFHEEEGDGDDG